MNWYKGNIQSAIEECRKKSLIFIVYISGSDEMSLSMDRTWEKEEVLRLCEANAIALKLKANSEESMFFSAIYPVVCVPSIYFIGNDGEPLDILAGSHEPTAFVEQLITIIQKHKNQTKPAENTESQQVAASASSSSIDSQSQASSLPDSEPVLSKEDKVGRAKELIQKKQVEKSEAEKAKEKNEEVARRQLGKDLQKLKEKQDEQERMEAAQNWKKEKEEARLARERVREQIARDRADKKAAFEKQKLDREGKLQERARQEAEERTAQQTRADAVKRETARLQFRLPDGSSVTETFPSKEPLSVGRAFLRGRIGDVYGDFTFMQSFPRREFDDSDMEISLLDLELAPSAVLILVPKSQKSSNALSGSQEGGLMTIIMLLLSPLIWLSNFIICLVMGATTSPNRGEATPSAGANTYTSQSAQQASQGDIREVKPRPGLRSRQEGNIRRLNNAMDDDEDMTTYNGNSTQQM